MGGERPLIPSPAVPASAIFVYGTLQRGEQRCGLWPRRPKHVERATVTGRLHDLGDYPALVKGSDRVLGELWHIASDDLEVTLAALDKIEWYGQDGDDLYIRRVVACRTLAGAAATAFTYFYAKPYDIASTPVVVADRDGFCHWTQSRGSSP